MKVFYWKPHFKTIQPNKYKMPKTNDRSAEYLQPKSFISYFHLKQDDINAHVEVLSHQIYFTVNQNK